MSDSVIEADRLAVVRDGTQILKSLTFKVAAGRVTGLLGPSGCGKTTLIRAIAGTQRTCGGSLRVLDVAAGDPRLRGRFGYAAQAGAVYGDLTVAENVRYFASVLQAPASDVNRVIEAVDLAAFRGRLVGRLSGGQRSRVNLAIALLGLPQLLLLDEPTVGLDPVLREELWEVFGSLASDGMSILVSSHVMDEAARCDELLLMRDGALLTQQTPAELRACTGTDDLEQAFLRLIRAATEDAA
jgi:ABC-2 type transport system ATP-binding protein